MDRKAQVAAEKEAALKEIAAAEKEANRRYIADLAEFLNNPLCTPQQRKSVRERILAVQKSMSDSSDDVPPPPRRRK